jgi:hypothetical protein
MHCTICPFSVGALGLNIIISNPTYQIHIAKLLANSLMLNATANNEKERISLIIPSAPSVFSRLKILTPVGSQALLSRNA